MADSDRLILQVLPGDDDTAELARLTGWLRDELLGLDVAAVDPPEAQNIPDGAKGVAAVAGWLAVNLGPEALKRILAKIADWAGRNNRSVELTIGGDKLILRGGVTHEQRQEVIEGWFARHPTSS